MRQLRTGHGRLWPVWLVPAVLVAVVLGLWAVVAIPPRLVDTQGFAPADRLRAANDLRATLLATLGGVAVIAGAIVAALNFRESSRQRRAAESQSRAVLEQALEQNRALLEQGRAVLEQNRLAQEQAREQVRAAHEQVHEQIRAAQKQYRATLDQNREVEEQAREQAQEQARAAQKQNRAALDLQRRGQMTERFTRAIEQLGQGGLDRLEVRIGAVYALEQIARDSAELHWPVVEVLTAHLRVHAPARPAPATPEVAPEGWPIGGVLTAYLRQRARARPARAARRGAASAAPIVPADRTAADRQAIATVIARRRLSEDPSDRRLDLHEVDLRYVRWTQAHLERAYLSGAHLQEADLSGAHLERADLSGAHLKGADFGETRLEGGADLSGAHLEEADLGGADLTEVKGLTWSQLELARNVDRATLPAGLADELHERGAARPVEEDTAG